MKKKKIIFEIMAIILIAIFCISISPKTLQNDTFYTIKIGEHIIQNKGIDMKDPFSWHEGLEYTYPHWLYDVIIYEIYSIGGMTGIYISTCVFAVILGIAIFESNSKLVKNKSVSFFMTLVVMCLLKDYIAARAQLVTFILFIIQIFFIEKLVETSQKKYGIGLILISILIANLHVAVWPFMFVLYLPYIAEYIIAVIEEKIAKKYKKQVRENYKISIVKRDGTKYLIIVMIICAFTGFLTPLGTTPYTYLIKTMQGNTVSNINEHLPLTLINNIPVMCTLVIFLAFLIFTKVKIRLSDLFMIGGLTYLMFSSRRQSTMFVLIGSIILNRISMDAIEIYSKENLGFVFKQIICVIGIIVAGVAVYYGNKFIDKKKNNSYVSTSSYPVEAADWILENLDVNNIKLFNEYNYGSYLLYRGIPVFIDSRADLYAPEFNGKKDIFIDFINTSNLGKYYGKTFEEYGITHVILYKNAKIRMLIDEAEPENYNKIYSDNNFVIYEIVK